MRLKDAFKSFTGFLKKHKGTIQKADRFTQDILREAKKHDIPGARTALDIRKKADDTVRQGKEIAKAVKK